MEPSPEFTTFLYVLGPVLSLIILGFVYWIKRPERDHDRAQERRG